MSDSKQDKDAASDSMQDKDAEISHLNVLLQSKENEIQVLNDKLLVLMHEVQQRDAEVSKLQDLLETKKSEIQELNNKLLELMDEVQQVIFMVSLSVSVNITLT